MSLDSEFCTLCGQEGTRREVRLNTANNWACEHCGGTLRYRSQGAAIVSHMCDGRYSSLWEARRGGAFDHLDIWEMALRGPFTRIFRGLASYTQSYYWSDEKPGHVRNGVVCQDVTKLTFPDNSIDLVVSSDVMEHVSDPWQGFGEIARVLRPGGMHVFTIPVRAPLRSFSQMRAKVDQTTGGVEHLLPEVYHVSGEQGKTLVFTDFGADIFLKHRELGMHLSFERGSSRSREENRFGAFVAIKLMCSNNEQQY